MTWNSVDNSKPERGHWVLVYGSRGFAVSWITSGSKGEHWSGYSTGEVTHWMELPKRPTNPNHPHRAEG